VPFKPGIAAESHIPLQASIESFDPVTPFLPSISDSNLDTSSEFIFSLVNAIADSDATIGNTQVVQDAGWIQPLVGATEFSIKAIYGFLSSVNIADSIGLSIIIFTVLIKLLTFPLTKTQLESTVKMQAIAPLVKETQTKYSNNPEMLNKKIAELYQQNNVNPFAGCLPALVQIPIFLSLYRALLNLAARDELNGSFLWIPSLEGPTFGAPPAEANAWLLKGWVDGVPSLGWHDTLLYLTIPVILVISQSISTQLMQPKSDDPAQQQNQAILKFLPFLIGWFSINVPAGLGVYWITNNVITTAITVLIRNSLTSEMEAEKASTAAAVKDAAPISPPGYGPAKGFATPPEKTPTPLVIDAEILGDANSLPASSESKPEGFGATNMPSDEDAPPNKSPSKKKRRKG